ncbi:MAG: hypothetical protein IJU23_03955 [Proteobacteria bacterium]|nr:hypothetical protein [Pseudomonadota bacterium]
MKYKLLLISLLSTFLVSACEDTLMFSVDESEFGPVCSCTLDETCENGVCVKTRCTNGELKCLGQQPLKCVDEHWTPTGNPCDENVSPCNAGKCTLKDNKCSTEKDKICAGSQPYICKSGTWKTNGSPCPDNRICKDGSCSLDGIGCPDVGNQKLYTCEDDIDKIGTIYQCANTAWTTVGKCPKSASQCTGIGNSNSTDGLCK